MSLWTWLVSIVERPHRCFNCGATTENRVASGGYWCLECIEKHNEAALIKLEKQRAAREIHERDASEARMANRLVIREFGRKDE